MVSILGMLSFLLIALASYEGTKGKEGFFYVAVFASMLTGVSQSMGEATFLGCLKGFPSHLVGFVSSGTGFAGITANVINLVLQGVGLTNQIIFLVVTPTIVVYFFCSRWLILQKETYPYITPNDDKLQLLNSQEEDEHVINHARVLEERKKLNQTGESSLHHSKQSGARRESKNVVLTPSVLIQIFPKVSLLILNLASVYFFEYSIITCFADRMGDHMAQLYPERADSFLIKEYFVILNYCYQIGVFISRSSLQYIKIKRVTVLSILQAINFVFLFLNTKYMFCQTLWVLCPLLIWVGLMGGASYVNVMHGILELDTLEKTEREAALVLSLMFNDTGVLSAAIFSLIIDNTLFKV